MPLAAYQQALADLTAEAKLLVEGTLNAWAFDATLGQVGQNVEHETALGTADFTSLLHSFGAMLNSGETPLAAWLTACRNHKLRGNTIPAARCPVVLGRVKSLADHANSVSKGSRGLLTSDQARKLLLKHSGSLTPIRFESFLRSANLGNYNLVWATFDSADTTADPFDRLPGSCTGMCTALGLGHLTAEDTLIVLVWSHADSGSPPLHRPTVADAEDYFFYRPRPEADAEWGLTEPLLPNPDGLQPQPEVVLQETTSKGLRLPFRVVQA